LKLGGWKFATTNQVLCSGVLVEVACPIPPIPQRIALVRNRCQALGGKLSWQSLLVRRNPHNVIGEKCCRAYAVARRAKLSARQVPAKGYDLRTRKSRSPQVQTRASRIRLHPHRT